MQMFKSFYKVLYVIGAQHRVEGGFCTLFQVKQFIERQRAKGGSGFEIKSYNESR